MDSDLENWALETGRSAALRVLQEIRQAIGEIVISLDNAEREKARWPGGRDDLSWIA
jgi:hypothetical protein